MRKSLLALSLVVLAALVVCVSCSESPVSGPSEIVEAHFSVSADRALYASVDTVVTYYTYTAEPLFSLETPAEIVGRRSSEYNLGPSASTSLGYFTAGRWNFHLYGYNSSDQLVREGETTLYLRKTASGINNSVPVTMYRSESRKGAVTIRFKTNNVSPAGMRVGLSYSYDNGSFTEESVTDWTQKKVTWTQMMSTSVSGFGLTVSQADGLFHIRGKATSSGTLVLSSNMVSGHKYYINSSYGADGTGSNPLSCSSLSLPSTAGSVIVTASGTGAVTKAIVSGTDYDFWYKVSILDLTAMYGSGNEPDKGGFEDEFPLAWYSYPTGTVIGLKTHEITVGNLQAGAYVFNVRLYDNSVYLGGASVATYVLGTTSNPAGVTTTVTGTIYPAEHLPAAFDITIPDAISGSLGSYMVPGTVGTAHTFTWTPSTGSGTASRYIWYLNGTQVQSGASNSYTYTPTANGTYTVNCVAVSASGTETGSAVCLLNVSSGSRATFSATWASPTSARSVNYSTANGDFRASSLVRVHVVDSSGISRYTGYLSATQNSGVWSAAVNLYNGSVMTFRFAGGTCTMTPSGTSMSGLAVTVEGQI